MAKEKIKFTRAPWLIGKQYQMEGLQCVDVYPESNIGGYVCTVFGSSSGIEERDEANLRLITAAPELLEALQEIVEQFELIDRLYSGDKIIIEKAKSIINKALI